MADPGWRAVFAEIYPDAPTGVAAQLAEVIDRHRAEGAGRVSWSEQDAWLIAYADQFQRPDEVPLATLADFYETHLADMLNGIHILPFYPWTSDDGFSVSDYSAVDPQYGTWGDIERIGASARLMVDGVINHMSAQSEWFQRWRADDPDYRDFFRTAAPDADLDPVVRARQHPLLTPVETSRGIEHVWTTFSADQVDLNYHNPAVLTRMVDVVLGYAARGASMIRLDAVGFLWKEESTPSIHLRQTHLIVQLIRACLDVTYPDVGLISETNVPHAENISYFGDGTRPEAQAVYQFSLPPLVLHSYATGDVGALAEWATDLAPPPPGTTFFNFLASHDGVGLRPLEGILARSEVERLATIARQSGGRVNERQLPDGSSSPYELNATWWDLVRGETAGDDALCRHLGSQAIMLAMRGIPGIYVHSLFASENDVASVTQTGMARSINRARFSPVADLEAALVDPTSRASRCLTGIRDLLTLRRSHPAFHPDAPQRILDTPHGVIGIDRISPRGSMRVYVNVSGDSVGLTESGDVRYGLRSQAADGDVSLGPWGMAWVAA